MLNMSLVLLDYNYCCFYIVPMLRSHIVLMLYSQADIGINQLLSDRHQLQHKNMAICLPWKTQSSGFLIDTKS